MSDINANPRIRRGLVLQGGGGKGAYQAGCLVALREAGIEFDAVAGTSVGALNAAAWSANRLDAAREFWLQISPQKILKWRRPVVFWGPVQAVYAFVFWPGITVEKDYAPPAIQAPTATYGLVLGILLWTTAPPIIVLAVLDWIGYKNQFVNQVVAAFLLIPLGWYGFQLLRGLLIASARKIRLSLFTTSLLERAIDSVIGPASVSIPTFVTLARRVRWFDPDVPNILLHRSVRVIGFPIGEAFIPRYERLDGRPKEEVSRLLVGSASLPEGIFPALRIGDEEYVDGGAADNTPVYPLVEIEPCDELWVLTVNRPNKKGRSARTRYLNDWKALDRRLRVNELGADECKKLFHLRVPEHGLYTAYSVPRVRDVFVPARDPIGWPARIVEVAPRASLGGFFSGTLNFKRKYVQEIFDQGRADTHDVISRYLESRNERQAAP